MSAYTDAMERVEAGLRPTPQRVYELILGAAKHQIATTAEGRSILAAGLGDELERLLQRIAANAGNPIAYWIPGD